MYDVTANLIRTSVGKQVDGLGVGVSECDSQGCQCVGGAFAVERLHPLPRTL